jgi:hypothetical protein
MHLHTYRDENHSSRFSRPCWSIDLVAVTAGSILVVGFACAIVALWVR